MKKSTSMLSRQHEIEILISQLLTPKKKETGLSFWNPETQVDDIVIDFMTVITDYNRF